MKDGTFPENALIFVDVTRDSIEIVGLDRTDYNTDIDDELDEEERDEFSKEEIIIN